MNDPPDHTAELSAANLLSRGRDDGREILAHDVGILLDGGVHVAEEHALLFELFADVVIDDFRFVLRGDAGEELALGFGDAQAVERPLDVVGDVVPRALGAVGRVHEVVDVGEVDLVEQRGVAPRRHRLAKEDVVAPSGGSRASTAGSSFMSLMRSTISRVSPLSDLKT